MNARSTLPSNMRSNIRFAIYLEFELRRVQSRRCGMVKRERLECLADSPFYTKRCAHYVGRRCRSTTIKDLAKERHLDWNTIKSLA